MAPLGTTICDLLHKTDYVANRVSGHALEPYGVTMYQAMSLIYVAEHEATASVNQRAIERYTRLSNPGVTKLINALERLELLERTQDPTDARSYILRTTPKGRQQAEIFKKEILAADARISADLNDQEREQLISLLRRIRRSADQAN